ncbi:type II secretion system F family protein [Candidatus Woesearchaeota archaeon]|nr:type II secretion system F family protein [Candidatus Woesearchaeota archaeon]
MKLQIIFLEEFGKAFIPKKMRPNIREYLMKVGMDEVPYKFFGALFYISLVLTYFVYIYLLYPWLQQNMNSFWFIVLTFLSWVGIQLSIVFMIIMVVYQYLELKIFNRTKKMEDILPEFLRYLSENLKGGMSFDKALWSSIRPRYGTLAEEMELVAKKVMSGYDVEEALKEFTNKYDSPMVKRAFNLIIEGMKGGSEIADLIERIESNLRETKILKQEMSATNTTYVIFMTVIVLFIAPALFGLSFNLLMVLRSIAGSLTGTVGAVSNMPINLTDIKINPDTFKTFSIAALVVISTFSSMIISIIRRGNIRQGIKYIPIYAIVSVLSYLVFKAMLGNMFSGLMQ